MAAYMTAQRKRLFSFLREHPDRQFSAKQITEILSDSEISMSAVYRNLAALEDAGLICRSVRSGSRELFYQYIHPEECLNCIHLTCIKCRKTVHMSTDVADRLLCDVSETNGFHISKGKTVLYGVCSDCEHMVRTR